MHQLLHVLALIGLGTRDSQHEILDFIEFEAAVRLDTPNEVTYFRNGGILQTVLRNLRG